MIVGSMLLYAGWPDFRRAIRSLRWSRTDGVVESVDESVHLIRDDAQSDEGRQYRVAFSYLADGHRRKSHWTSLIAIHHKAGGCLFTVGQVIAVYYDPEDPSSARLFRGVKFQDLFLVAGGVAFLAATLLPIAVYFALAQK
ncbi:MAG: hypothetical protein QG602_279 [Verrucomicrobiota bacterium]|nr:hypothetical protein [Verrucomicrobiota bacterium]